VAVTSLSPDHLDWHGTVERYYADKLSLCTKPGVELSIAEGSDTVLRAHESSLGPHLRWVVDDHVSDERSWMQALALPGQHNVRNASVARAVLVGLGIPAALDAGQMAAAARDFDGLPSRCRSLGHVEGVEFVDDSLSTNVLPVQAALAAYADRPVALLVGGHDRGLDYAPLGRTVADREQPTLVVTMPDNGPRIGDAIRRAVGDQVTVVDARDIEDAVTTAFNWATPGGVVLLSPAAPSFGQFSDFRDRARAFAHAITRCGTLS
jgi:UDP-N-acetylmuramoylalanine--D-glutamate ligase